jgi:hypothetical protein
VLAAARATGLPEPHDLSTEAARALSTSILEGWAPVRSVEDRPVRCALCSTNTAMGRCAPRSPVASLQIEADLGKPRPPAPQVGRSNLTPG